MIYQIISKLSAEPIATLTAEIINFSRRAQTIPDIPKTDHDVNHHPLIHYVHILAGINNQLFPPQ